MANERQKEIERLMQIASRIGAQDALAEWLRTHPHARVLPSILTDSASGRPRVCYPSDAPRRRGRPKKIAPG